MDDLISRQQAIDALDEIEPEVADGYGYQYEKWRSENMKIFLAITAIIAFINVACIVGIVLEAGEERNHDSDNERD